VSIDLICRKDSIRLQEREAAKMEYKNDIREKLASVGQLYLAINKITGEQYAAIMSAVAELAGNNTNDEHVSGEGEAKENGALHRLTNDQLSMLQGAISDLDFKISTLLKQYEASFLVFFSFFL
jgi:hypothetical protein